MTANITIIGTVATEPRLTTFDNGGCRASFRLAESERRFDRETGQWLQTTTNWYGVNAARSLGENVAKSLHKGDRVIVTGKLKVRRWETADGRNGYSTEVEAEGLGHDLRFGSSSFTKSDYGQPQQVTDKPETAANVGSGWQAEVTTAGWHTPQAAEPHNSGEGQLEHETSQNESATAETPAEAQPAACAG